MLVDELEQVADVSVSFNGMAEWFFGKSLVPVPASYSFSLNVPFLLEIMNDALNCSLRDADFRRNLPEYDLRIRVEQR